MDIIYDVVINIHNIGISEAAAKQGSLPKFPYMDKDKSYSKFKVAFHFLLLLFLLSIMFEVVDGDKEMDADIIDAAKRLFSSPHSCLTPTNLE